MGIPLFLPYVFSFSFLYGFSICLRFRLYQAFAVCSAIFVGAARNENLYQHPRSGFTQ